MDQAHAFEQAVLGTVRTHAAVAPGDRVLVGVSGGADSTSLLVVLEALVRRGALRAELAVAHLNHRMRGAASDRDEAFVRELAARLVLPCFVGESTTLAGLRSNREAAARDERHAFLARCARDWGASRVALAHTRDDQAETVLMRLARGGGPASLAAMQVVRRDGIVRPLLELPHAACVEYLRTRGCAWVEDESNQDERQFRNRVRRRLLPLLEAELGVDVRGRLARLAGQLHQEAALAEQRVAELLDSGAAATTLPLATLRRAGSGGARLLHAWLARAGIRAGERQIGALVRIATGGDPSAAVTLAGGMRVLRCYDELRLATAHDRTAAPLPPVPLAVPGAAAIPGWRVRAEAVDVAAASGDAAGSATCSYVDRDRLDQPLWVRGIRAGDRVRLPYGRRKLADILIDAKIPRHERAGLAVIATASEVLWVPGVVRSIVAGPSAATRRCAILHAERAGVLG